MDALYKRSRSNIIMIWFVAAAVYFRKQTIYGKFAIVSGRLIELFKRVLVECDHRDYRNRKKMDGDKNLTNGNRAVGVFKPV